MPEPTTKRKHRKPDPEIVVLRRVLDILEPFPIADRKRILDFVRSRLDAPPAQPALPGV